MPITELMEYLRARMMVRIGRRTEEQLRGRVFDVVAAHALKKTPGVGGQPINDLATIRQYLSSTGPFAFIDMPWVPVYLLVIFAMHWVLGLASLGAAIAIFALAVMSERSTRAPVAEATKATVKASIMMDEGRRNAEALHSLGMRGALRDRWSTVHQAALDAQTKANDAGGGLGAISRVLRLMIQSGILALGAYLAIKQEISSGSMIAASIIMSRALAPVETAVANWQQFLSFRKARERLTQLLKSVPPAPNRMPLPAPRGKLDVEQLYIQLPGVREAAAQRHLVQCRPRRGHRRHRAHGRWKVDIGAGTRRHSGADPRRHPSRQCHARSA
ncbi:ABC transporter transmembrane domain-containing protein [Aestuariivirga sp.]|uniref:ABC transporter transmembrane domain-containing protein n=1 Tax=Aestuariivirga sp. TaxID=2650926 RepID=UPI0039E5377C